MSIRIAAVSAQSDLAWLAARWRVNAFFDYPGGYTVEEMAALILAPSNGPNEIFVLFDGDQPVGTAGLMHGDLESRPDLTPWLGGVYVEPAFRGLGHATTLVRCVEACARAASVPLLWLYTSGAEGLYRQLGWQSVGIEQENGHAVTLMRREL